MNVVLVARSLHCLRSEGFAALPPLAGSKLHLIAPHLSCVLAQEWDGVFVHSSLCREAETWAEVAFQHWHAVLLVVQKPACLDRFLCCLHVILEFLNVLVVYGHKAAVAPALSLLSLLSCSGAGVVTAESCCCIYCLTGWKRLLIRRRSCLGSVCYSNSLLLFQRLLLFLFRTQALG